MLDPYHKPMESVGECDHANDHIADVEAKLAAAEERVRELEAKPDNSAVSLVLNDPSLSESLRNSMRAMFRFAEDAEERVRELEATIEELQFQQATGSDKDRIAQLEATIERLQDEIAGVHHYLLEMFEFFWHDGNSRTHLNVVEWLERPHTTPWMEAVNASEGREMSRLPEEDR